MNRQQHESTADGDGMSDKSIIQKAREALSKLESEAHSHGVRSDFRHQLAAEIRAGLNEAEQACAQGQGDAEPVITNEMKAECIGEFTFTVESECGICLSEGVDEDCETCHGEMIYIETIGVPWNTCKQIYKAMAKFDPSRVPAASAQSDAEPVAWWDGDFGEPETAFSFEQDEIYTIPVCAKSPSAGVPGKMQRESLEGAESALFEAALNAKLDKSLTDGSDIGGGSRSEWVKYSERLPALTGYYIVAVSDPDDIGWSTNIGWSAFWNGGVFEGCDPVEDGQPVTHWMPLPNPPNSRSQIMSERISLQGFLELLVIAESATAIKLIEQFQRGDLIVEDKIVNETGSVENV